MDNIQGNKNIESMEDIESAVSKYFCAYTFLNSKGFNKKQDEYLILSGVVPNDPDMSITEQVLREHKIKYKTKSNWLVSNDNENFVIEMVTIHEKYREKVGTECLNEILDKTLILYGNDFIPTLIRFQKLMDGTSLYEDETNGMDTNNSDRVVEGIKDEDSN